MGKQEQLIEYIVQDKGAGYGTIVTANQEIAVLCLNVQRKSGEYLIVSTTSSRFTSRS